jgi:hypothetical protein
LARVTRTLRNAFGVLVDLVIGAFGLVLMARGLLFAAALPLVVAGVDLMSRLGLLPFVRRGTLTSRERGDLIWGSVLAIVGTVILAEELVVVVADGGRGARHVVAIAVGGVAVAVALLFFGRLVRSRH